MIDNVQAAMNRMAAIRSAMGGTSAGSAAADRGLASTAGAQDMFAQALTRALAQSAADVGLPSWPSTGFDHALTPAGSPRSGPPPGLEAYANGRIPASALAPVAGTDERLWAPAAAAFDAMRRDAARAGVSLPVVDAYRPLEDQVRLADELGLYKDGGLAAVPGTSQHGWGRAIDLDLDDKALAWMRANAWQYGFSETVPREPWHWEYHPST